MFRPSVRVRPATNEDIDGLVELLRAVDLSRGTFSGRGMPTTTDEQLRERLVAIVDSGDVDGRILTVAVDESSTAILGLLVTRGDDVGALNLMPVLNVTHLLVSPKWRRRGVGRALLVSAVHLADDADVSHVVATVASNSRDANRYLSRLGFAPLVTHRIASTHALRKSLSMSDATEGIAAVRRGRLLRAQRVARANNSSNAGVARGA